jgi:hypothetical protein
MSQHLLHSRASYFDSSIADEQPRLHHESIITRTWRAIHAENVKAFEGIYADTMLYVRRTDFTVADKEALLAAIEREGARRPMTPPIAKLYQAVLIDGRAALVAFQTADATTTHSDIPIDVADTPRSDDATNGDVGP